MHTLIAMAAGGHGTAIVPSFALPTIRRFGAGVARLTEPAVKVDFYGITKKGREPAPMIGVFEQALTEVATQRCEAQA